jgi:membrane peptidoglycan carboxypeptidase
MTAQPKPTTTVARLHAVRKRRARRQRDQQKQRGGAARLAMLIFGGATLLLVIALVGGGLGLFAGYVFYARQLPPPSEIARAEDQFETTLLYDSSGQTVLYEVVDPNGDRQSIPLPSIPANLINATIAIEDKTFYSNPGFDLRGMARAVFTAVQGEGLQGASTITQQLVKNILIAPEERTIISQERKIKEVILAGEIARLYSKDQILEWYLNSNFYGNLAYGVGTAAQVYFGKPAQDLNLGEAAMLAAIPQNPALNPIDNPTEARIRQSVVLDSMVAEGYITAAEAEAAKTETIIIRPATERYGIIAPHFALYARRQAETLLTRAGYDGPKLVLGGGLRIYTTLDLDLNYQAECTLRAHVGRVAGNDPAYAPNTTNGTACLAAQYLPVPPTLQLGQARPVGNGAVLVLEPTTGQIKAMVGSIDYYNTAIEGNFNAALGLRQPASTFKPFVYVTAFASAANNYTPAKMVLDVPTTFNSAGTPYTPRNEDGKFHGPMSIREALANSYNIPVVQVLSDLTVGQVLRRARQLGFNTLTGPLDQYGLALALGSGEVSLLDLSYAYANFATLGQMAGTPIDNPRPGYRTLDPVSVLRIEDRAGKILWQYDERGATFGRVNLLSDALAYAITSILADNEARLPAFGRNNALQLSRPAAVKTGTSNDNRDAWTVGYTPFLVTGVWVGNNNNTSMGDTMTGHTAAAPIWHAVMEYAHNRDQHPVVGWQRPSSLVEASVCQDSGLLPTTDCPRVKDLFYVDSVTGSSTLPNQTDIYWVRYRINSRNGLLATAFTPPALITERVYYNYPPEAQAWARAQGLPLPPSEYDSGAASINEPAGDITEPAGLARVRGQIDVLGNLSASEVVAYTLEYGEGINPTQWFAISGGDPTFRGDSVLLGRWDTSNLNGLYTLRLGLTLTDQAFQPRTIQITVDNTAPTVAIISPLAGAEIEAGAGAVLLEAEANDDLELAQVSFYWNDQLIATAESLPFRTEWRIIQTGEQRFYAVATDRAGNRAQSLPLRVEIRP